MTDDAATADGWRPVPRTRTYQLVINAIEDQILSGALAVGDALPAERDLAARLAVSRPAVREALRVLEAQGVVSSGVGSGPGAGTFVAAMPADALTHFLRLHLALTNFEYPDIIEARVALERSSCSMVARAAAADPASVDLAAVRAALTAMDDPALDRTAFNDADTEFHTAIARACGNNLVTAMTVAIRNALRPGILAAFEQIADWTELAAQLQAEHRALFAAIEAGDATRAADLAETHIRAAYQRLPALHTDADRP